MTLHTQAVLKAFLTKPDSPAYCLAVAEALGLATGTVQPILRRLENAGWLVAVNEAPVPPTAAGGPHPNPPLLLPQPGSDA
ncbi:hypothetical protein AB0A60_33760 [Streptomyces sp. NPDC046275]|uniref:hypothetical protein n=1 Tax=Streptomyces sp. NPDC046275 TaxID=3157201 RepID=UPI0033D54E54